MIGPSVGGAHCQGGCGLVVGRPRLLLAAGFLLIGLCYLNGLGSTASSHIDENYYLVSGLTMVETGNYLTPMYEGQPRFQKPILPYWAVSSAYRLLGPSLAAARIPALIAALLTIALTYRIGCFLWESRPAAILSALALAANIMFFRFARLCLTDMMLTLMMTAAVYFFARWYFEGRRRTIFRTLSVLAMAIGVMVKGPLGAIIPLGTIALFLAWRHGRAALSQLAGFFSPGNLLLVLLVTLPWPLAMYHRFGDAYLDHVFLRETLDRVGVTSSSLAANARRYASPLVRYLFPWWLALVPLAAGVRGGARGAAREDDGGRALLLWLNILTILVLLLFAMRIYSFKYLLPLMPAFSLLVGRQLAACCGRTCTTGPPLRAFHAGAAILMAGVGLASLALSVVGLRLPELASPWPVLLAVLSLAGVVLVARLRSQQRYEWAAGSVAGVMILQLSLIGGAILPLLRPDAVSTLAQTHLKKVLRSKDRIMTIGLDERKRAWLSVTAGRVATPYDSDQRAARKPAAPRKPAARRTYLVVGEKELDSLPIELSRRYSPIASAHEFLRTVPELYLQGLRRRTPMEIPRRTFHLLADHRGPGSAAEPSDP